MLRTPDLPGTLAFYRDALGFRLLAGSPADGWMRVGRDGIDLMFSALNDHENDHLPGFTGSLYFEVPDVDDWWSRLHDAAHVCYPPEDFPYGMREFGIYDNNGLLLQFGKPFASEV